MHRVSAPGTHLAIVRGEGPLANENGQRRGLHGTHTLPPRARVLEERLLRAYIKPCLVDVGVESDSSTSAHEATPLVEAERVVKDEEPAREAYDRPPLLSRSGTVRSVINQPKVLRGGPWGCGARVAVRDSLERAPMRRRRADRPVSIPVESLEDVERCELPRLIERLDAEDSWVATQVESDLLQQGDGRAQPIPRDRLVGERGRIEDAEPSGGSNGPVGEMLSVGLPCDVTRDAGVVEAVLRAAHACTEREPAARVRKHVEPRVQDQTMAGITHIYGAVSFPRPRHVQSQWMVPSEVAGGGRGRR